MHKGENIQNFFPFLVCLKVNLDSFERKMSASIIFGDVVTKYCIQKYYITNIKVWN